MNEKLDFLNTFVDISRLDATTIESLVSSVGLRTYRRNQMIVYNCCVYKVRRGVVKISALTHQGELIFNRFANRNAIFGHLFLAEFTEEARVTSDSVELFYVSADHLQRAKLGDSIYRYVLYLERCKYETESYYHSIVSLDVKAKLVTFLERLARTSGVQGTGEILVPNHLTLEEIARAINASRQSVSAHLSALEQTGWLERDRSGFIFRSSKFQMFSPASSKVRLYDR